MAKYPQAIVTGHTAVSIGAKQRKAAEKAGNVKLSNDDWAEVESICEEHITWSCLDRAHPDATDVSNLINKVNKAAKALRKAVEDVTSNQDDQVRDVANSLITSNLKLTNRMCNALGPLYDLEAATNSALSVVEDNKIRGTSLRALRSLVQHVARVYKRAGGHPTSYSNEHKGYRGSPFVDFTWVVCTCLPPEHAPTSQSALGELVYNINKELKKVRGKTLSEFVDSTPYTKGDCDA